MAMTAASQPPFRRIIHSSRGRYVRLVSRDMGTLVGANIGGTWCYSGAIAVGRANGQRRHGLSTALSAQYDLRAARQGCTPRLAAHSVSSATPAKTPRPPDAREPGAQGAAVRAVAAATGLDVVVQGEL